MDSIGGPEIFLLATIAFGAIGWFLYKQAKSSKLPFFTSPAGAALAAICFFLPWVRFDWGGETLVISGAQLGDIFWLVFLSAIAILVAFFYFNKEGKIEKAKSPIIISSLIGLGTILYQYFHIFGGQDTGFGRIRPQDFGFSIRFGAIGTLLGLIASLFGAMSLKPTLLSKTSEQGVSKPVSINQFMSPKISLGLLVLGIFIFLITGIPRFIASSQLSAANNTLSSLQQRKSDLWDRKMWTPFRDRAGWQRINQEEAQVNQMEMQANKQKKDAEATLSQNEGLPYVGAIVAIVGGVLFFRSRKRPQVPSVEPVRVTQSSTEEK